MNNFFVLGWMITILSFTNVVAGEEEQNPNFEKGYELYNQGQYDEAIKLFQQVLKDDPKNLKAQVYYGVSLMGKDQFDQAIEELQKALTLDEKFPLSNYALAVSYARKLPPDIQKAEEHLKRAKEQGYLVPPWFEQYVERLKTGKVPVPATQTPK